MAIQVGNTAPDFRLKDNRGNETRLADYRGKRVLLSWHPLAWTSVCAAQMKSLEENKAAIAELNMVALGLSVDSVPSKNAWAKELGVAETRLLSDFWPHGGVAKAYGLFREEQGTSQRANVILDEAGQVVFVKVYDIPQLPDISEIFQFLET
ncbi:MAG: redoxin domain-containing protein [Candidatus Aminicenantaceae bacterium]